VRRSTNTDTPLPPEESAGQNPPDGAMIDYVIGSGVAGPVTLEISDSSGKILRRFSSSEQPAIAGDNELNVPTYWIRPERTVSIAPGMHRFVWDLRLAPPDAIEHEYPISAIPGDTPRGPQGPAVRPGDYTVSLTVSGKTLTQTLHIDMDPRVKTSATELAEQFNLGLKIAEAMHEDFVSLGQIRSLRDQISRAQSESKLRELGAAFKDLDGKAAALEGDGSGATYLSTPEGNSFTKLNSGLATLLGIVDSADAAPTTQAVAMFTRLQHALTDASKAWEKLQAQDLAALNAKLKRMGAQALEPGEPQR